MANTAFKIDNGLVVSGQSADIYSPVKIFSTLNVSSSVTIGGSLTVTGNLTYSNTQISGELVPTSSGIPLGNTANRFDLYARNIYVANNVLPTANGIVLGGVSARFDGYFTNINSNGIITVGTTTLNSTFYAATANNANTVFGLGANGIVVRTGSGSGAVRTLQSSNGMSITNANGVSGDPTMTLLIQDGLFSNTTGMYINASAIAIGTLPITHGGTGSTSQAGAANNILPAQGAPAIGQFLRSTGSAVEWADGPLGFTGSKGFTGSQGTTGSVGFTGSKGDMGNTGSTGPQGPIGFTGSASTVVGPTGPTGAGGSIGFTGSLGAVGPTGPTGGIGPAGFTGSQGNLGYIGSAGTNGTNGFTGSKGDQGVIGYTGSRGNTGYTGSLGGTGPQGVQGVQGPQGVQGVIGYTGSRGPDKLVSAGQIVKSATGSLTSGDTGSHILATTAGITLTLPTSAVNGSIISLSNTTTGTITLSYSGSAGTDGPTSLEAGGSLMLISDGNSPPFWRKFFFSGGTGIATLTANYLPKGNGTAAFSASQINDNGTDIGFGVVPVQQNGKAFQFYNSAGPIDLRLTNNTTGTSYDDGGLLSMIGSDMYAWNMENAPLIFGANNSEKMRITTDYVLVNTTASIDSVSYLKLQVLGGISTKIAGTTPTSQVSFFNNYGRVGYIGTDGTTTTYFTSSDIRLKKNITYADDTATIIDNIKVRKFDWKVDDNHQRYGFVAQELHTIYPEAVGVMNDPEASMSVDYSKLVPVLVKEIQSLRARVSALEV